MAIITVLGSGSEPTIAVPPGNRRRVSAVLVGDAAYPTGGSTIAPSLFGLSAIDHISVGLNRAGDHIYVWNSATSKLLGFSAVGTEIVNTTDVSAHRIPVVVWGI